MMSSCSIRLKPRRIEAFLGQVLDVVLEGSTSSAPTPDPASEPITTTAQPPPRPQPRSDHSREPSQPLFATFGVNNGGNAGTTGSGGNTGRGSPAQTASHGNPGTKVDSGERSRESSFGGSAQQGKQSQDPSTSSSDKNATASTTMGSTTMGSTTMGSTSQDLAQLRRPQTYVDTGDVPRIHGYLTLVETLEWHETPSPRLFIVLPRTFVEDITPNYNTFRLFWMCEYMGDASITPHLDFHTGLDLDRPDEFFAKFGPHLLLNFRVFKYSRFNGFYEDSQQDNGNETRSNSDPHVSYDQAIELLKYTLNMSMVEVEASLDIMIDHVRTIVDGLPEVTRGNKSVGALYSETWETINLPQLTPQDFSLLRSFLCKPGMTKSGSAEVHNLYRSTDADGHVHWLCHAHLYHVHPFIKFGQTFMKNHGAPQYDSQKGQIVAEVETPLAARLLYGILVSSPGFISELVLQIGWNMSEEDLGYLRDVVVRCRLPSLVLKTPGNHLASPAHAEIIMSILEHNQLQSFTLENAQDVLKHVNPLSSTSLFNSLRTLRLKLDTNGQDLNAIRIRLLLVILNSPNLKVLEVEWMEMEKVFSKEAFLWEITKRPFRNLAIQLKVQDQEISMVLDRGNPNNHVHLEISDLVSAGSNPHIYYGSVQHLTVKKRADISDSSTEAILQLILAACSALVTLTLTCNAIDFSPTERIVRKIVMDLSPACALERLILKEAAQHNITATFSLAGNQNDLMYQRHRPVQVDVTVLDHHPGLELILINYATVIRTLNTTHAQTSRQLTFVSKVILQEESSQLESLLIALDGGQLRGYECVEQILEGSSATLKQLTLVGSPGNVGDEDLFIKTLALYKGKRLILAGDRQVTKESNSGTQLGRSASTGQTSSAETRRRWIEKVKGAVSKDTVVIIAEDFKALCDVVPGVTANNIAWLEKR